MSIILNPQVAGVPNGGSAPTAAYVQFPAAQAIEISGPTDTITPVDDNGDYVALATEANQDTANTHLSIIAANSEEFVRPASATVTSVAGSTSSVEILDSSVNRKGAIIYNDSSATMYLKFGTSATTSSFTTKIGSQGYFSIPAPAYTGVMEAVWDSATGFARVTEVF